MSQSRPFDLMQLQIIFGDRLKERVPLSRYTAARVGGLADALISANSKDDLLDIVRRLWNLDVPYLIIGGGSNVLVSDAGIREVVIYNRARQVRFDEAGQHPTVWAESGANFGLIARQAASRGFSGLEWAAGIPGTIGGAVVGNAGAHGNDVAGSLVVAEILHQSQMYDDNQEETSALVEDWDVNQFKFGYRTSILKRQKGDLVVLAAVLKLKRATTDEVQKKIQDFVAFRQRTQPPGASMGSMFKNPSGDYAGRLIESAGLKGTKMGGAEISPRHANFFINHGDATASDIKKLIDLVRSEVGEKFGIDLELEIELVGEW
ncbi:MAG: UDP-N-acetylmuramate dehydrogenase [Anaerolineales bacterium]|nr:UDP-N-acetylmuramate dehydrogenase [Anaerolineales bacterium]